MGKQRASSRHGLARATCVGQSLEAESTAIIVNRTPSWEVKHAEHRDSVSNRLAHFEGPTHQFPSVEGTWDRVACHAKAGQEAWLNVITVTTVTARRLILVTSLTAGISSP